MAETEEALQALQHVVEDPSTENVKAAARALVKLRSEFEHEGLPDWAGRSLGYRMTVEKLYRDAGVPSDSEGPVLAKLRYHVGNFVREMAPKEELEAIGLKPAGPRSRNRDARAERRAKLRATVTPIRRPSIKDMPDAGLLNTSTFLALVEHAKADVRLLRQAIQASDVPTDEIVPQLRELMNEILDTVQAAS